MTDRATNPPTGMSARAAATVEFTTSSGSALSPALALIFQPFSLLLFSIGCGLVVVGALAFNLASGCGSRRSGLVRWSWPA